MHLQKPADNTMRKRDKKCNRIQNESVSPKCTHENLTNEGVIVPESGVKILSRGDLLGAINCLFPELNLKSSSIKLKENFSLFCYSPKELTRIFESGRKYRSRIMKNKNSIANYSIHSFQAESKKSKFHSNVIGNSSKKNVVLISNTWKKAQSKQNTFQLNSMKQDATVQFQSNYLDFSTKYLEIHFPDRLNDFKNVECLIQALNDLHKQISKAYNRFVPFNPNLPVLKISQCDTVVQRESNSPIEKLTITSPSTKCIRNRKASSTLKVNKILQCQNDGSENDNKKSRKTGKGFNRKVFENQSNKSVNKTTESVVYDFEVEIGRKIAQNLEDILSDDTFSPRYQSKHASEILPIFRKSLKENLINTKSFYTNSNLKCRLKNDCNNSYESVDEKLKLLEIQAEEQY